MICNSSIKCAISDSKHNLKGSFFLLSCTHAVCENCLPKKSKSILCQFCNKNVVVIEKTSEAFDLLERKTEESMNSLICKIFYDFKMVIQFNFNYSFLKRFLLTKTNQLTIE